MLTRSVSDVNCQSQEKLAAGPKPAAWLLFGAETSKLSNVREVNSEVMFTVQQEEKKKTNSLFDHEDCSVFAVISQCQ